MKNSILFILFLTLTLFGNKSLFAQGTGKISGKIIDQKTSEPLIGTTVLIQGTSTGASANVEGSYIINGLKPGKYSLIVRYVGYTSKSIDDIEVKAGEVTSLDVALAETASQALSDVVVRSSFRQESVNALYAIQKNSISISDGISSELIKKSPDRSTSDVLKRVSGATIQDNKFVVVRGLSDRYNTASLDGSPLPSTEPNRKAFSFDIVPANLIDNIIISKTASADMPGDFSGGYVQVLTKDIPDQNFVTFGAGLGYNTQSTFKDFKSGNRTTSDYFAFDNSRALKSTFPTTLQIVNNQLSSTQSIQAINSLNNDFNIYTNKAFLNQNYQFTLGNVQEIGKNKNRFGTTVALTYRNSQNTYPDYIQQYDNYDYRSQVYNFSTNVGALANFAYSFGKSKITFKNLYNRIFDDKFTYRTGQNTSTSSSDNKFYAFDPLYKGLFKSTIEGEHQLGAKTSKLKWNLGYSNVMNDQPDQRKVNYKQNLAGQPYFATVATLGKENARVFSKLNENIYSGRVDYNLPVKLFKQSNLKVGLNSQYRDRNFNARFLGLTLSPTNPAASGVEFRPLETLFGQDAVNGGAYRLEELSAPTDTYKAHSFTNAGYAMLDSKLGDKVRVVYGLRVEKFDLELSTAETGVKQPRVVLNNTDLLPSVNFTYAVTPKANFRASYFRSVARPEFRELAPFSFYDYELLATVQGEPTLQRSIVDNGDIRYEFYPSAGQIFSVSAFYKHFQNAIEPRVDDINSSTTISYFNSRSAYVYGLELEARKTLDFVNGGKFFKATTAYANLALTRSSITNTSATAIEATRPLVGQSPYVINAGLQHSEFDNKLSINILYNRLGKRVFYAGGQRFSSIYEMPRNVIDAQIGYKVFKNKGEFKLSASDILNDKYNFQFELDGKPFVTGPGSTYRAYRPGSNYSLSFNYTF